MPNAAALSNYSSFHVSIVFPVGACRNPQEDDAKFLEFSKRAEDGPFRASRLSKKKNPRSTDYIQCITRQPLEH